MFTVFECVVGQHDVRLVLLAALVWLLGSFTLFLLLERSTDCIESRRQFWLATAAVAAGVGVWATHFIAMLAYNGLLPLRFEPGRTAASAVLAVLFFWVALRVAGRQFGIGSSLAAGSLAACGVITMHFTGMAAIVAPAVRLYDWSMIAPALILVSAAFVAAFASFGRLKGRARIAVPASLAMFGVLALHYTAMSATTLIPGPVQSLEAVRDANGWLVPVIVAAALGLIASALAGAFLDRMLTDLRGIADATLEGLAIISGGRIVEVNSRLAKLLERSRAELIGTDPARWLIPSDGQPLDATRDRLAEAVIRHENGDERVIEIARHAVEYRGRSCKVLAIRDLTDRKLAERQIEHLAAHDGLTGLPNRTQFSAAIETLVSNNEPFALFALDLDRFKVVNDTFGHAAGDQMLCRVAELLTKTTGETDLVARVGGDEFLIIQQGVTEVSAARQLAQCILDTFADEMDIEREPMAVGVSVGVALFPRDAGTVADLRHHADVALYQAKDAGRGIACFFDQEMDRHVRKRRELAHELRHVIARDELRLVFQPLVDTATSHVIGYEALLRWQHPVHGYVPPQTFIPIAEEVGAIVPIGEWVLRRACEIASRWPEHLSIAVNVSALQFQLPSLADVVEAALRDSGLSPHRLELEVTESVMLRNRVIALATLRRLKRRGVAIVMDDFGTGYSSLSNLQAFPFDKIKIDRSFVAAMEHDEAARSIIRAIVSLGKSLALPIVAEGVETDTQHRLVLEAGCAQAQGYLFGIPSGTVTITRQLNVVGG